MRMNIILLFPLLFIQCSLIHLFFIVIFYLQILAVQDKAQINSWILSIVPPSLKVCPQNTRKWNLWKRNLYIFEFLNILCWSRIYYFLSTSFALQKSIGLLKLVLNLTLKLVFILIKFESREKKWHGGSFLRVHWGVDHSKKKMHEISVIFFCDLFCGFFALYFSDVWFSLWFLLNNLTPLEFYSCFQH